MEIPQNTKHRITIWPAILLLGIHPEKTTTRKDTCTPMFIAVWYTIARTEHNPNAHRQRSGSKRCGTYMPWNITQLLKKNEIMTFAAAWMDLQSITVSEVRQRVRQWQTKVTCYHLSVEPKKRIQMNLFAEQKRVHRLWKTYGYQRGQVGRGRGGRGVWDGNVLKLGDDDGCTTINIIKIHWRTSHRGSLINEPNWYPWRWGFDPWPGSVG